MLAAGLDSANLVRTEQLSRLGGSDLRSPERASDADLIKEKERLTSGFRGIDPYRTAYTQGYETFRDFLGEGVDFADRMRGEQLSRLGELGLSSPEISDADLVREKEWLTAGFQGASPERLSAGMNLGLEVPKDVAQRLRGYPGGEFSDW